MNGRQADPTARTEPRRRLTVALLGMVLAAVLVTGAFGVGPAELYAATTAPLQARDRNSCTSARGASATIATAKLFIEYNATDDDLGVHGAFDDAGWSELCVFDPRGRPVLEVEPQARLKRLTMGGIFFESREPPSAEFSFEELKAAFPEGQYQVLARSFDGKRLIGAARFTHNVPAPPTVTAPLDGAVVSRANLAIQWKDVTKTVDGERVKITGYQIIITKVEHSDPHGFSQPIFDVHVPADRNSLGVAVEFLEPQTEYELEVLALELSGNQTISVSFFTTN